MKYLRFLSVCFLSFSSYLVFPQPGSPDPTFGVNGLTSALVGTIQYGEGQCMALTPDQKVVVAGYYHQDSGTSSFAVVRFLPDGSLDPAFGTGGIVTLPFGVSGDGVKGVTVQSDGSIVLVGYYFFSQQLVGVVYRLTSGGLMDPNFNNGSMVFVVNYRPKAVAITSTGKIVVACDNGIFKLKPNGALDLTFGTNGTLNTGSTITNTCLLVQPDNKIVVGGIILSQQAPRQSMVRRYTTAGLPDQSFGIEGVINVSTGNEDTEIFGVAIQTDNKIVVAGCYDVYNNGWQTKGLIERLNSTGFLDNTFSGNGKQTIVFTNYDILYSVAVQDNGRIVATGFALPETGPHAGAHEIALCRLNADGTFNTNFGTNGKVMTYWPNTYADMYSVAIQADGKIVVGGSAAGFGAARYLATGSNPPAARTMDPAQNVIPVTSSVHIFPNPAVNQIEIEGLSQNGSNILSIVDNSGKLVLSKKVGELSNYKIDINKLAPGNYFLKITGTKNEQSIPFIKMQ
ncbi:MAG: hypothetical protein C5B52_16725 [Bacteroidetes bacterium]|nr:MAG: hypothetical protein C5B52_16725 [Bacteroidota bacterium]